MRTTSKIRRIHYVSIYISDELKFQTLMFFIPKARENLILNIFKFNLSSSIFSTGSEEGVGVAVKLQTCIRQVFGSTLFPDNRYSE